MSWAGGGLAPASPDCASGGDASAGERSCLMKVLVTGADGFVGRHLIRRLVETGHTVTAACRPGGEPLDRWLGERWRAAVQVVALELTEASSVESAVGGSTDAIVHLA